MSAVGSATGQTPGTPDQRHAVVSARRVLIIVHTLVYGQHLRDIFLLLESDTRIRLVFTVAPHAFNDGAQRFLRDADRMVMPWKDAVRTRFDLALAAGSQGIDQVTAPVVRMSHGASHIKLARTRSMAQAPRQGAAGGMSRQCLVSGGRVVPKAVVLAHEAEYVELARWCPEALPVAEVAGDPFVDRLMASLPHRMEYRRALGLGAREKLIVVSSTWRPGLTSSHLEALLPRLRDELPKPGYRTAVLIHPNVWEGGDGRRLDMLLDEYRYHGIEAIAPETDWRQLLVSADWLIGDHGSVTLYGTTTRTPILLARFPLAEVNPFSPATELASIAPELSPARPLHEQLTAAAAGYRQENHAAIAARITSEPGRFNRNIQRLVYRLLQLEPPALPPATEPLPLPLPLTLLSRSSNRSVSAGLIRS